jgi:hypothetical protein
MPTRLFSTKPIGELHEADGFNELQRTRGSATPSSPR